MPLAVFVWHSATASGEVLTLDQALQIALQNNLNVVNADLKISETEDQLAATRTRQYPALNTGLRESRNFVNESFEFEQGALGTVDGVPVPSENRKIETKSDFTTIFSVEASQPLTGLYKLGLDVDKLKVQTEIDQQNLRNKRQEIAKLVKEQYYEILETQSALEATDESIAFYRSLVDILGNKVKEKTALEYQLLDADAKLAQAEHDRFKQNNTLLSEKERMNLLLNREITSPFMVTADLPASLTDMNPSEAQAQALEQRPDVKEARLKLDQAETELDIKQSAYFPEVNFTANYTKTANTELIPDESFFVGIIAKWEFFDWGRRSDEISKARRSINIAHNNVRETDNQVITEVNSKIRDVENAENLVGVTKKAQAAAREKLRVTTNQYQQQAALLDDLFKAESDLADANNDHNQAVLAVWNARAGLTKALGEE